MSDTKLAQADTAAPGAHNILDGKDGRTHKATAQAAQLEERIKDQADEEAKSRAPTDAAKDHGNKPSRGAEIDEELEKEDQEILAKKDAKK